MMRDVKKIIEVVKYTRTEEIAVKEEISSIFNDVEKSTLKVELSFLNDKGEKIDRKEILVERENYNLLLSDDPIFETGKQVGSYREDDLWKIIDRVENGVVFTSFNAG